MDNNIIKVKNRTGEDVEELILQKIEHAGKTYLLSAEFEMLKQYEKEMRENGVSDMELMVNCRLDNDNFDLLDDEEVLRQIGEKLNEEAKREECEGCPDLESCDKTDCNRDLDHHDCDCDCSECDSECDCDSDDHKTCDCDKHKE